LRRRQQERSIEPMPLTCSECENLCDDEALGWEGHLVDLDDDGEDEVVFFCPSCAAREFGWPGGPST
jgi:hypothetical protein